MTTRKTDAELKPCPFGCHHRESKLVEALKKAKEALELYQKAGRLQGSSDKDLGYAIADRLYYRDEAQAELATREALTSINSLLQPQRSEGE